MKNNLKFLRERSKMTLKDLAKETFTTDSNISKMETGKRRISEEYAFALADYFHVSLDFLYGRSTLEAINHEGEMFFQKEIRYNDVISCLKSFTTKELLGISGAIDFLLDDRRKNHQDSILEKETKPVNNN